MIYDDLIKDKLRQQQNVFFMAKGIDQNHVYLVTKLTILLKYHFQQKMINSLTEIWKKTMIDGPNYKTIYIKNSETFWLKFSNFF